MKTMNRREFTKAVGLSALALATRNVSWAQKKSGPQISITMDDFFWQNAVHQTAAERNKAILGALKSHNVSAAIFVIGKNVEDVEGKTLLNEWNSAGHLIGNHTYSHRNLNTPEMTLESYQQDTARADEILKNFSRFQKYFLFPFLKEGDTVEKRDGFRAFLKQHGYRTGHVTIDTADWAISPRLQERLKADPRADLKPYRNFYLDHMWERAEYYDSRSRQVLGRSVRHTLLCHYNLVNGLFLGDVIEMFKSKGWQFVSPVDAMADPVFSATPNILPAGNSILWALAKEKGMAEISGRVPELDGDMVVEKMKKLGL